VDGSPDFCCDGWARSAAAGLRRLRNLGAGDGHTVGSWEASCHGWRGGGRSKARDSGAHTTAAHEARSRARSLRGWF
jgi:hypothetical protein